MHKLRDAPGETEESLRHRIEEIAGEGRIYVLGLGNTDRGDDGAGILVALELKKSFPSFSYSEHDGIEGTVLDISEKKEAATVLFVDAADLRRRPGTVTIVPKEEIKETEITTHRVAVALMATMLEKSGKATAVICIQPKTIEFRAKVTKPVVAAIEATVRALHPLMSNNDS